MIKKYTFGNPIPTEAVVKSVKATADHIAYFNIEKDQSLVYRMEKDVVVYGLGENVRGINKRGFIYESKCSDDPLHLEDKRSLYGAHNFIIIDGPEKLGVFIDDPGHVTFDIGYTKNDVLKIISRSGDFDLYLIEGENLMDIVKEFRSLIGQSYIAPKWALGYGQSRWSYMNADEVRQLVKTYQENHIPLDSVYLDIDYMEDYKDFTINKESFPNFSEFVKEMRELGIHLVPIIDAGVKIEDGYDVYEEGVEKGYFVKDENGNDFVAGVWPGRVHFPDVLNQDARRWFGEKYKVLLDQGIDGFWNDMNEPAIFYSEDHLKEVFDKIDGYKDMNLDIQSFFEFKGMVADLSNNESDYQRFYHNLDGRIYRHDKVHNLYGFAMTQAAGEAFETLEPNKRILLFSRSSYIGMHRFGGIWTGDNCSWWTHLLLNIKMMPSLNMCGFLYSGADIGGFGSNVTEDLMLRWLAFGIFTPLMRNHSAMGTRRQELYEFEHMESCRHILDIRYGILPYLYSEYVKAALRDDLLFQPLSFVYPEDTFTTQVEDQLMVGESIMIAPVYEQNAKGRYVYLPERMKMVKFVGLENRIYEIMEKGHHYIPVDLDEVVIFIRENHLIPMSTGGQNVTNMDFSKLELLGYITDQGSYELYDDDGFTKNYDVPEHFTTFTVTADKNVKVEGSIKTVITVNV